MKQNDKFSVTSCMGCLVISALAFFGSFTLYGVINDDFLGAIGLIILVSIVILFS